ncbi:AraC family transcriptional regulator [Brachybacterium sp. J144]|uniref:AraC family transcriptional regulator n=1 Tax=Brachybacterium sp. J144 TaxID=3116487 RepID=UPI002E7857BB|nr:AraC family transcriptional regulator [Brachybacterium sp. J144]MEE1650210.1 AraC family transcriptional regulator [Brachybacterium sp. J144]
MDPLSDALHAVRSRNGVLHRSQLRTPFGLLVDESCPLTVLLVTEGEAWIQLEGADPMPLARGVVHLVATSGPYRVLDRPGSPVRLLVKDQTVRTVDGAELPRAVDDLQCLVEEAEDEGAARTVLISGDYTVTPGIGRRLIEALPAVAAVALPDVAPLVGLLEAELDRSAAGRQPVLDRWLDLLLTAALRSWFEDAQTGPAWCGAMADPQLGAALRALHADPSDRWSVERLAQRSGMSRSAFAERFTAVLGVAPMTYLAELRMDLATDQLLSGSAPLTRIARDVGYANPYGFSAAYKRIRGRSPAQVRAGAA